MFHDSSEQVNQSAGFEAQQTSLRGGDCHFIDFFSLKSGNNTDVSSTVFSLSDKGNFGHHSVSYSA